MGRSSPRRRTGANQDARLSSESRASGARPGRSVTTVLLFSLLSVLTLLLLASHTAAAATQTPRHILFIYTGEKDLPMNLIIDGRLRASFREKLGDGVELFSEYLDFTRFPESHFQRKQLELLHDKYLAHGLDLIVVIALPALDQIQLNRDWFFPTTPVVFCCVTEAENKDRTISPGVTGILAKLDFGPTLELALRLHPGTRRVVVIAGAAKHDAETVADARRDFRPFEGTAEFRYLVGLPMAELRQEVSRISGDAIIIYLSIYKDGAGTSFLPRNALDQLSQVASVPIYGYYDSYIDHGVVGGFMASFEIEATNAARLGLRILAGEKPEDLSTGEATSCAYMFDWRQLKRWRIDEGKLPPASVVRFRDPSFWDLYRWHVIGVLSLCALQTMLILGLLAQRARRRRAEKESGQAEDRFRTVVESAPNAVVVVNTAGKIVLVNAQCERLFSYQRADLVDQPVELLVPERFRAECTSWRLSVLASPSAPPPGATHELCGRRKDGSEFPVEIGLTPMQAGQASLALCVVVDVTARRQAEEARRDLAHASRLSLVGELTASIAHEINQPLGAIMSNADAAEMLLDSSSPPLDQVREILGDIRKDNLRASEVIRSLRMLLSKRETQKEAVDINEVSRYVVLLVRAESRRHGVAVESEPLPHVPRVRGDMVQLQQVLLNLVVNGMEAAADSLGEKRVVVRISLKDGGPVEIAVSDTGPGIPRDRLPRLFEQFYTTKKNGMGVGLSIVRSLVEAHGGRIWAVNNPHGGATFRFTLPIGCEQPGTESSSTLIAPVGAGA